MPPKPKTEAERQQLRTLIIDAARELFVARGVEAVTMREIAKRIGYSATSIYLHFADKEAVLRAILDVDMLALATSLNTILEIEDPVERMQALGYGYAEFALSFPNHYRLMFMAERIPCDPEKSSLQKNNAEQDAYFLLKTVVNDVYLAGRFKAELQDVDLIAQIIWAGVHGVCSLEINMACDKWVNWADISARLQLMQTVLIRGLLREPT
ncbi:TetR/AcrR family transcriptional regulator [Methylotenera versatilis]|jgi:AcrR family transcriptional regulator|uniref:Transcriptional regulator, TetR family n=1 Tax=Methylotenera versatilis (strain 301) TaxID=666681 RepID=D7DP55_METV0|nr:TetR/AcrR family transcriptional regulator [Methylotenera versatilis]ADI31086.1 transcriptional regulator, TetR family [Methylotenera versatilis 301]